MRTLSLKLRVWISGFLFAALIFLDGIVAFNNVAFSKLSLQNLNKTTVDVHEEDIQKEARTSGEGTVELEYSTTLAMMEVFGLSILVVINLWALVGIRRTEAYLLVPWLFVYLIGIGR